VVRVALQALSAVLGGTQSLHTNGFDEALALPTELAATLALRTQQIIAFESGVPRVADPLGGAYAIEYLTDEMTRRTRALMEEVDEQGGAVAAIESGYVQDRIDDSAYNLQQEVDRGERVVVGVNRFRQNEIEEVQTLRHRPELEQEQTERLARLRSSRDNGVVRAALQRLEDAARGGDNLLGPMKDAHAALATVGEVSDTLRKVFGTQDASPIAGALGPGAAEQA
jgi:methylmalonyl-CoA mutase N-terminal domain/subunit